MGTLKHNHGKVPVYSFVDSSLPVIDVHHALKTKDISREGSRLVIASGQSIGYENTSQLDWTDWLPYAAKEYHLTDDPADYIFVPVITMPSDLPNRNGVAFPLKELLKFNVEQGCLGYETWRRKPTFYEHANSDPTQAKGIILDVRLRPMVGFGGGRVYKVVKLLSFNRAKDPELVRRILAGELNTYSMGAWVDDYTCSYCGANIGKCAHLHPRNPMDFYILNGKLVCRNIVGMVGFETSGVETPAYSVAASDVVMKIPARPATDFVPVLPNK